jgi:hypothetical protein
MIGELASAIPAEGGQAQPHRDWRGVTRCPSVQARRSIPRRPAYLFLKSLARVFGNFIFWSAE